MSEVRTWIQWRYEDHCRADDKFVKESDHLAAVHALEARVAELEAVVITEDVNEKMTTLVGLLEMWRDAKARPDYLVALLEEANEFLTENNPFEPRNPQ